MSSGAPYLPDFTAVQWAMACVAAFGIGVSKSGLPGISLLHVLIFAWLFPGVASTGVVLPMLVAGDVGAIILFRRHASWAHIAKTIPPAMAGVLVGCGVLRWLPDAHFQPVIGAIILVLAAMQLVRSWKPEAFTRLPHSHGFALSVGFAAGVTTMIANAAGPVMGVYLVAVGLPKEVFVGTSAWFFLLINLFKVPFSAHMGLINAKSLLFNCTLIPCIVAGLFAGRWIVSKLPQRLFDSLVLAFAILVAFRLLLTNLFTHG
ncbi:MAG: sulfite exporter TauE/SafE family protein [Verrucomicrobia bacterium]|nr:sulfite exporter TauE/SafE family protein [Verrucomicrobiota bacterium]